MKRLIQRYTESRNPWCYYSKENNPCGCGSNCYHLEYDRSDDKIYCVCNGCKSDIYEIKEEYIKENLDKGVWLSENDFKNHLEEEYHQITMDEYLVSLANPIENNTM